MPSSRTWLELANQAEGDAIRFTARATQCLEDARRYRAMAAEELKRESTLTPSTERTYIRDTMQAQTVGKGRKVGRPLESEHPFPAWLKAKNITVTEWASDHNDPDTNSPFKRERVKSWFTTGSGARPITRHAADIIEKESRDAVTKKPAVPATPRIWKNGIRE